MIEPGRHQEETPRPTYPLTALQHGMLFHHLLEPNSGVDIEQLVISLPEHVDGELLARAWEIVSRRHDVLRTAFRWHETDRPVQVVQDAVEVPFQSEDWRALTAGERERRLASFLEADRYAGFAMDRAPLFRVALFRCAEAAYELVWTFHHAILDGRSFTIVLRDVFAWYDALERGGEPDAAPSPPPFRDHVAFVAGLDSGGAETYWRERLRGRSAPTPLPAGFPGESPLARHGERQHALSAVTTSALARFARDHDLTVNTLVQGAWALVLARHSGEADVVFGATRACRRSTIPGADEVAGLFINTLPVRVQVDVERSLGDWLRELRTEWTALRRWENTPLPQIQRWTAEPAGAPLFQSIVVFENQLLESSLRALGGRWQRRAVRLHEQTNYPLTLAVYGDAELTMKLAYDRARFGDASIARILGHVATILEGFAQGSLDRALGDIPWLTAAERTQVVEEWNATATVYPRDASVGALFSAHAADNPAAVAVVQGDRAMTYRELDERANQVARRLQRLGVRLGAPVGLCLPRSLEMVVGALGILKAGGAYVPLDPTYPRERLAFLIADTGLQVVLTADAFAAPLPEGPLVLRLDANWDAIATESTQSPQLDVPATAAAYIIYTSGSTGTPKGVVVPHRGIVRLVVDTDYAHFGPDEVGLAFAPLTFDLSTFEMWGPLLNGGRLVVFGAEPPSFADLTATIRDHGVTTLWLTAALFHQLVDRDLDGLRPLRQLLAGGDILSVPHVVRVLRELPACRMINGYGPTENATFTTCFDVPRDWNAGGDATSVPIGRPIANTTTYVLDERMQPVAIGVIGRLYTGGDGVALGYHARPELTAERFVPDPFSRDPGARMYDTGDRASWRPDGTLDFFGRADQQLKIRGFRVEPGEVEAALLADACVLETVVVGRDGAGGKQLVAYVVPRGGATIDVDALRASLAERVPAYEVPSAFVVLDALPLSANGKVDRARLPSPRLEDDARRDRYVAPRSATEAALAAIWAEVLDLERIGVRDNFLALGGHSLLAMQVVSRIRDAFRLEVPVRALFEGPTLEQLARTLIALERKPGQVERVAQVLQRVAGMSLEEVRLAASASAAPAHQQGTPHAE